MRVRRCSTMTTARQVSAVVHRCVRTLVLLQDPDGLTLEFACWTRNSLRRATRRPCRRRRLTGDHPAAADRLARILAAVATAGTGQFGSGEFIEQRSWLIDQLVGIGSHTSRPARR